MRADVTPAARRLIRAVLRDGSTLRLRAPVAADLDAIEAFVDRLSPESRYLRFHGYGRRKETAREYAAADGSRGWP
jgi:hypothetical protein